MFHGIDEQLAVEDVHVEVVSAIGREVAVHKAHEVIDLHLIFLAERSGRDGKRVRNAVVAVLEGQLGHRGEGGNCTLHVASVHGVGARCERHALGAAVGRCAGMLAVHHV